MMGKLLFIMLSCTVAFADSVPDSPGWDLSVLPGQEDAEYPGYVLSHSDGRPTVTLQSAVAEHIKDGRVSAEQIYLSRTRGKSKAQETQFLGNSGLVAPPETTYSTMSKEEMPEEAKAAQRVAAAAGSGGNTVNTGESRGLSSMTGFPSASGAVLGGSAASSGNSGSSPSQANGAKSTQTAGTSGANGTANGTNLGNTNAAAAGGAGAGGPMGSGVASTKNGATSSYLPHNPNGLIYYDTNSGVPDPNIEAGSAASRNTILQRAGKYAR